MDEPRASFPTVTPTLNGTSIVLGPGNGNDKLLQFSLVPAGFCPAESPSCLVTASVNFPRLVDDFDPYLFLKDGAHLIGGVIFDNLEGGAGITTGTDLGSSWRPLWNEPVLSDVGHPGVGEATEVDLLFDLRPTESRVTVTFRGQSATRSLVGPAQGTALSLVLGRDNEGSEQYQLNSLTVSTKPAPSELADLTLSRSAVAGCKSLTGTVTLSSPAPAGGAIATISDTLTAATPPATVKIAEGATSKSFTIMTVPVSTNQSGTVTASLGGANSSQPPTIRPMGLSAVNLSPSTVIGGKDTTGTVTLECAAGPGPVTVDLSTSNVSVASPVAPTVVVPQGPKSRTFTVATNPVFSKSSAVITGEVSTTSKSRRLNVVPAAVVSPARLGFGLVAVSQTSGAMVTTLRNDGVVSFAVNSISLTGSYAAWFSQTNNCPANSAVGASCTISVTFTPAAAASKSAKLSVATSATAKPPSVSLSGTGIWRNGPGIRCCRSNKGPWKCPGLLDLVAAQRRYRNLTGTSSFYPSRPAARNTAATAKIATAAWPPWVGTAPRAYKTNRNSLMRRCAEALMRRTMARRTVILTMWDWLKEPGGRHRPPERNPAQTPTRRRRRDAEGDSTWLFQDARGRCRRSRPSLFTPNTEMRRRI